MTTYTSSQARQDLYKLIDHVAQSHEPVYITGRRSNAVMLSEEDFHAIQETLYLLSVPGMRESIVAARKEPKSKCKDKLDW